MRRLSLNEEKEQDFFVIFVLIQRTITMKKILFIPQRPARKPLDEIVKFF